MTILFKELRTCPALRLKKRLQEYLALDYHTELKTFMVFIVTSERDTSFSLMQFHFKIFTRHRCHVHCACSVVMKHPLDLSFLNLAANLTTDVVLIRKDISIS